MGLVKVATAEKVMPDDYLNQTGNDVTDPLL